MTAPVRVRPAAPRRAPRTAPSRPAARAGAARTTTAAQRAYQRKTERTQRFLHLVPEGATASAPRRVPFVALVIGLLAAGLVATLWLSTRSAEGSYQIGAVQETNQRLSDQAEALRRDVATASSPSALAQSAAALGMVPSGDVAHLVVATDGTVSVVGKPAPASGTPGPSLIAPATPAAPAPAAAAPAPAPAATAPAAPAAPGIVAGAEPAPTAGGA